MVSDEPVTQTVANAMEDTDRGPQRLPEHRPEQQIEESDPLGFMGGFIAGAMCSAVGSTTWLWSLGILLLNVVPQLDRFTQPDSAAPEPGSPDRCVCWGLRSVHFHRRLVLFILAYCARSLHEGRNTDAQFSQRPLPWLDAGLVFDSNYGVSGVHRVLRKTTQNLGKIRLVGGTQRIAWRRYSQRVLMLRTAARAWLFLSRQSLLIVFTGARLYFGSL